jgi:hypothetical protein
MDSREKAQRVKDSIEAALMRKKLQQKDHPLRQGPGGQLEITPSKPDPEKAVEALMAERINNRINPETGMPFYSEPEEAEEDPKTKQMREIRMQMLQEAAKTGKMPEYLKKY